MQLPTPIRTYFAAGSAGDADRLAAAFATDGVVRDEGEVHTGRAAIRAWWQAAQDKYDAVAQFSWPCRGSLPCCRRSSPPSKARSGRSRMPSSG